MLVSGLTEEPVLASEMSIINFQNMVQMYLVIQPRIFSIEAITKCFNHWNKSIVIKGCGIVDVFRDNRLVNFSTK
jgi:hypothetical protein